MTEQWRQHEELPACLSELSDEQSEAIALAYLDGQTYAQVAEVLNVSVPEAKTSIRGGLGRLRESMPTTDQPRT